MADLTATSTFPDPPPANLLRPRREPFEYGLLSIPKLVFTDPTPTLSSLRSSLPPRVDPAAVADSLQIPPDHASLLLQTLSSVHHLLRPHDDASVADVYDLLLFLYIQSYKKLLPRSHKDSVAVADVWPSTSAFDGYLSALSPLQLVRSNSRRFMPSQADEEAHQLSYLQKHMGNIVSLLAEPVDDKEEESLVLTLERFEHLGFLIQFGDKVQEGFPLGQATPFFANSDPDMPPAPVPASQVLDWILQNIAMSLEALSERVSPKENGPANGSDPDVAMADAYTTSAKPSPSSRGVCFIEGISKQSLTKQATDLRGPSVKVLNCHDSAIYILAPLRYATIYGCSDATIVLGAVGKAVRIEHCERVHVIVAANRVCIASCRECVFFLGVNQRPLIVGDNHKLQVAPYNTFYTQLEEHIADVGIKASLNKWDEPLTLGMVDPHDSLSHPAGISDTQAESATLMDPDQFTNFLIPNSLGGEAVGSTKGNPFPLPVNYKKSQQRRQNSIGEIKQMLRGLMLEDSKKRELASALHVYFKDWLNESLLHRIMSKTLKLNIDALLLCDDIAASGNIRQLYCLQAD